MIFLLGFSVLGGPFLPDSTKNANRQITEIPLQKAGTQIFLAKILPAQDATIQTIPVGSYKEVDDVVYIERIINKKRETIQETIEEHRLLSIEKVTFLLGTDALGRDLFSRLILGIKISLLIGFFAVMVSCILGVIIGLLSGYFGGWVDTVLMTFINSMWSIPTVLLVFALVLALGRGMENIILAIGLTMWIDIARLIRGLTQSVKEKDYVLATKALSYPHFRIVRRHIFPNMMDPLIVLATANFATAILVEAGISYLGFGIQPPAPSIGILLSENYAYILGGHYIKALAPAIIIIILVLALNIIGTALRDHFSLEMSSIKRS